MRVMRSEMTRKENALMETTLEVHEPSRASIEP
jgi:hypothetical protein